MNRTIHLFAGALLLSSAFAAHAQSTPVQLSMDTGLYIGGAIGKARASEGCSGICDTSDRTWHLFAGYQVNRHLAVEAGYSDFGKTTTSGTLFGAPVTSQTETNAWEVVGVGLLPLTDQFTIYAKAGLFYYDSDAITTGAAVGPSSASGTEFTFGGGVQYAFTRHFAARLEWQSYADVGAGVPGFEKDDVRVWRLGARVKF